MPSRKPTLVLSTPVTASFPAEALMSAASVRTPHSAISTSWRDSAALPSAGLPSAGLPSAGLPSAGLPSAGLPSAGLHSAGLLSAGLYSPMVAIKTEEGLMKTPLSPPVAYMDFLKLASPGATATSPCTSSPVTASAAASNSNSSATRPRILHRASISGPVKVSASNLGSSKSAAAKSAAAAAAAATASSTSLASTGSASASNSDTESSGNDTEDKDALDSGPSTASSNTTDCCTCGHDRHDTDKDLPKEKESSRARPHKSPKIARIDTAIPASAYSFAASSIPTSAPPIGRTTFPSLKIPVSPAVSNANNANPSNPSPIRSPFSAKSASITSPFDWESALKRYAEFKSPPKAAAVQAKPVQAQAPAPSSSCAKCTGAVAPVASSSTSSTTSTSSTLTSAAKSIRHIREVVTRTVTYTPRVDPPRMNAPPKGKKRKIDCEEV